MTFKRIALLVTFAFAANSVFSQPAHALYLSPNTRTVVRTGGYGALGGAVVGLGMLPFAATGLRGIFVGASVGLYLGIAVGFFLVSEQRDAEHNPTRAELDELDRLEKTPPQSRALAEVSVPLIRW